MIKKLRSYMHNPNYNLTNKESSIQWDHVAAVAKQEHTLLTSKHIFIDSRSKMKVKFAWDVLSESTALAMEDSQIPYSKVETSFTHDYIRMCDRLFKQWIQYLLILTTCRSSCLYLFSSKDGMMRLKTKWKNVPPRKTRRQHESSLFL